MALVYAGVVRTEGVERPVWEGGFSSFRTESFPQGHTFLCVASRIGDVLSSYFFENLSGFHRFVISPTDTYMRPHLKVLHLR